MSLVFFYNSYKSFYKQWVYCISGKKTHLKKDNSFEISKVINYNRIKWTTILLINFDLYSPKMNKFPYPKPSVYSMVNHNRNVCSTYYIVFRSTQSQFDTLRTNRMIWCLLSGTCQTIYARSDSYMMLFMRCLLEYVVWFHIVRWSRSIKYRRQVFDAHDQQLFSCDR